MEPLVFDDIVPIEIPVRVGKDDYVLREATGEASIRYTNAKLQRLVLNSDGKPTTLKGMGDLESFLVSLCLFTANRKEPKDNNIPVAESEIRSWPNKIQKKLFDKAKEISDLDQEESVEDLKRVIEAATKKIEELEKGSKAKNSQSDGMDGSD